MKIVFTGGSGKAGKHVIPYLLDSGHKILNIDLVPLECPGVNNLRVDITNSGQVFNSLSSYLNIDELKKETPTKPFDAVVHFAAIPRILLKTDEETFRVNTLGTYNVIEAAVKLGIKKIVIASSETTYGICFAKGNLNPNYLPIDEDHDTNPMDSYGLSKVVNEQTARAFQLRSNIDIYALRIGNVIEPHEYQRFKSFFENPKQRLRNIFNYIDARDLGQIVDLCLKKDCMGFEIFNAANDTNSVNISNNEIIKKFYPSVPLKRKLEESEALFSNHKIKKLLGFKENHNWRKYLK
jgi:nucleoside-diphosphate-sugar epimerase